jgi:tRNA (guanine37-N1)-methyltransferase
MNFGIVSLFPQMFDALNYGMTGRAIANGHLDLTHWHPRDYVALESSGYKHRVVDDRPYGGGPGMVMMVQPLRDAIKAAKAKLGNNTPVMHLSPAGTPLTQEAVIELAKRPDCILVASRYEGVDERLLASSIDEEWSIGDYVLTGGELPAMVLIDAICRFIPGVLGHEDSAAQDSFMNGLLDYPHYTRPEEIEGLKVPSVLLEGNHQHIKNWRLKQALGRTWLKRPDLLTTRVLTPLEEQLLNEFISEFQESRGKIHE